MTSDDLVSPELFVAAMERRWVDTLKNEPNPRLRTTWRQLCEEFNLAAARSRAGELGKWRVLTPETGTGKTEGTILYCSMLPPDAGVLIVEELTREADRIAREINEAARDGRAVAAHSKNVSEVPRDQISKHQVVVVTHSAFLRSLEAYNLLTELNCDLADEGTKARAMRWSSFREWAGGSRCLTIIDESPQLIEPAGLSLQELREVQAVVGEPAWQTFPDSKLALGLLVERLARAEAEAEAGRQRADEVHNRLLWVMDQGPAIFPDDNPDHQLCAAARAFFEEMDLGAFRSALQRHGIRSTLQMRKDPDRSAETHDALVDKVRRVGWLLQEFVHYSTTFRDKRPQGIFSTGRCIVPQHTPPAVILDATGQKSPIYSLLESVEVVERKETCRRYGNVSLHVGRLRGLGKHATSRDCAKRVPQQIAALRPALRTRADKGDERLLCVGHKDLVPTIVAHADEHWRAAHWNGFHGVNDYQHFPAIAFFSLLFPDDTTSELEYNAAKGPQSEEWFRGEPAQEVRRAMRTSKLANNLVQAINRIRCRRPIDGHGNCLPTDVFLPLPHGQQGDRILELVVEQMPEIRVVPWELEGVDGASRTRRGPLNVRGALVRKFEDMEPGEAFKLGEIREQIGCAKRWLYQVVKEIDDAGSELSRAAAANRVRYHRGRFEREVA